MCLVRALKLLLLAVALFGAEVGELAYFVDDISNDYIQAPASSVDQLAKRAPAHLIFQGSFKVPEQLTQIPFARLGTLSAADTPTERRRK